MDRKQFGLTLKNLRESQGLSKCELARRTGFTLRAIQYWEQGKKNISLENAEKLLNALGMMLKIDCLFAIDDKFA